MSEQASMQYKSIRELTQALNAHLAELSYRPSSLKTYRCILSRFVEYCETKKADEYTVQLGRDFIWERYGMVLGENDRGKNPNRAIHMLTDFHRHGMIFKQHNVRREGFSAEYGTLFESFLESLHKSGIAESSIQKYRNYLFRFEYFLRNRGVTYFNQIELYHVNAYIESLAGLSQNTACVAILNLKKLLNFAHEKGYHHTNYSDALPYVRYAQSKRLPAIFTADETARILEKLDKNSPIGKRNYAIILIAAKLGLRVSDVLGLTFQSIDWKNKCISVNPQQKTGIPLELPLPEDVGWAIIEYLQSGRPKTTCSNIFIRHNAPYDGLTSNFGKDISRAVQKAGIKVPANKCVGMHTFRHSLATSMLNNGATIFEIAQVLGHARPESSEDYISLSVDMLRQCALEVTFL